MLTTIILSLAEVVLALFLFILVFNITLTKNKFKIALFFFFVLILSIAVYFIPIDNSNLISVVLGTVGIVLIYRGPSRKRVLAYSPLIVFAISIVSISLGDLIVYILRMTDFDSFISLEWNLFIDLFLIMVLGPLVFFHARKKGPKPEELVLSVGQYVLFLSGEVVSLLLCTFVQGIAMHGSSSNLLSVLPLISSMFAFLAVLFLTVCLKQQISEKHSAQLEREKNEYALFVRLQSEHYQDILQNIEELHRFKHDYDYHIQALNTYILENKIDKARAYLETMSSSMKTSQNHVYSGLLSIDSIIEGFERSATEKNISWQYVGRLPDLPADDCFALCTIFSNLMRNAIEACQEVTSDRFIDTTVTKAENFISIVIKNSCLPDASISGTSKSSPEEHGWGLKNVQRTVEAKQGSFKISITDSVCTADVIYQI